jgi:hypothetical protein
VHGAAPAAARVVCSAETSPHGGATVTLHSGVRVRNATEIELEVGVQTPVGTALMEPQALGTLPPGAALWLPAARAEAGLLCVRPAPSYNPARPPRLPPLPLNKQAPRGGGAALTPRTGLVYSSSGAQLSPPRAGSGDALLGLGAAGAAQHRFEWSAAMPMAGLARAAAAPGGAAPTPDPRGGRQQLTCAALALDQPPCLLCAGAAPSGPSGASWDVVFAAPLTLHNALPVPVEVALASSWAGPHRLHLQPNQQVRLLHVGAADVQSLTLRAAGFEPTEAIKPPAVAAPADAGARWHHAGGGAGAAAEPAGAGGGEVWAARDAGVTLRELGPGQSSVEVSVRHGLDPATGAHVLRLTCGLWVYNCSGVALSLRRSAEDPQPFAPGEGPAAEAVDDDVPRWWVPPLQLPGRDGGLLSPGAAPSPALTGRSERPSARDALSARDATPAGRLSAREGGLGSARAVPPGALAPRGATPRGGPAPSVAGSVLSVGRSPSTADVPGLSEILDGAAFGGGTGAGDETSRSLVSARSASRARGIADSMETAPAFELPSRWPAMAGGLHSGAHRLRLQLRATQAKAPPGRTFWSPAAELDALGGAAAVAVPCPAPAPGGGGGGAQRAAYPLVLTSAPVPGSDGALALCVLPRYVLRNMLDVPIQYKQQGTAAERELRPAGARAVRWADALRPPRLCVRVQEAGWLWSGGFLLDTPGDLFVKIRHRDRGETMLVRVGVATTDAGVVRVTLSHNPAGFAPYRVENCSLETLHARQAAVREQQDVLRPYCSLNYAWDEPTAAHVLTLELPGARPLGTFALDKASLLCPCASVSSWVCFVDAGGFWLLSGWRHDD